MTYFLVITGNFIKNEFLNGNIYGGFINRKSCISNYEVKNIKCELLILKYYTAINFTKNLQNSVFEIRNKFLNTNNVYFNNFPNLEFIGKIFDCLRYRFNTRFDEMHNFVKNPDSLMPQVLLAGGSEKNIGKINNEKPYMPPRQRTPPPKPPRMRYLIRQNLRAFQQENIRQNLQLQITPPQNIDFHDDMRHYLPPLHDHNLNQQIRIRIPPPKPKRQFKSVSF